MNEYRVKVIIRNNLLLSAIEQAGYKSQAEFSRSAGILAVSLNALIGLRVSPIAPNTGSFTQLAKDVMEALGACPTDLWTDIQLTMHLDKNTGERTVSEQGLQFLLENNIEQMTLPSPEDQLMSKESDNVVNAALEKLTPREKEVLNLRFKEDLTCDAIGEKFGVTGQMIRHIEGRALRRLRHPILCPELRDLVEEDTVARRRRRRLLLEQHK